MSGEAAGTLKSRYFMAAVFLLALTTFAATIGFGYVWDDPHLISRVSQAVDEGRTWELLNSSFFVKTVQSARYYRPVMLMSLQGDVLAGRGAPWFSHLVNALIHALNSVLVFSLLRRFVRHEEGALAGGLLFAVHPVHTEAVAAISSRMDLLALLLLLPSVLNWIDGGEGKAAARTVRQVLAALSFFLACLTKEVAFMLPAILVAWEVIRWRMPRRETIQAAVLLALSTGTALLIRALVFGREGSSAGGGAIRAGSILPGVDPWTVFKILLVNMRLAVLPFPVRSHWAGSDLVLEWTTAGAALSFLALSAWCLRRNAVAAVSGLAWWAVFTMPVLGFFNLGQVVAAERYAYIPSAGVCLMVAGLVASFPADIWAGRVPRVLAAGSITVLAVWSVFHARPWKDEVTLFSHVIRTNPSYPTAYMNLGIALGREGRYDDALEAYGKAEGLAPEWGDVAFNRGNLFFRLGRYEEALRDMDKAISSKPGDWEAALNRGNVLLAMGRGDEAADSYRMAASLTGTSGKPLVGLGVMAAKEGAYREALRLFEEASARDPSLSEAREGAGDAYRAMGMPDMALQSYLTAIELSPANSRAAVKLGDLLMELRRYGHAIQAFRSALAADPSNAGGWVGYIRSSKAAGEGRKAEERLAELQRENPALAAKVRKILAGPGESR